MMTLSRTIRDSKKKKKKSGFLGSRVGYEHLLYKLASLCGLLCIVPFSPPIMNAK